MLYSVHLLRFFAAAIVVVSHASNAFNVTKLEIHPGDIGVDIFFIISGIVIGLSTKDNDSVSRFALKRFIRIVPAYWLATFAMLFLLCILKQMPPWSDLWASLTFTTVFRSPYLPIVFPGWTLSYEMAFYGIYGLVLALVRSRVRIVALVIVAAISSFSIRSVGGEIIGTARFLEFAFGLLIASNIDQIVVNKSRFGFLCFAIFAGSLYSNFHGPTGSLTWGVSSLLLIIGVLQFEHREFLRSRISILLGDASYAIYIFHVLIMTIMYELTKGSDAVQLTFILAPVAAILGGVALHVALVDPMTQFLRFRFLNSVPTLVSKERHI